MNNSCIDSRWGVMSPMATSKNTASDLLLNDISSAYLHPPYHPSTFRTGSGPMYYRTGSRIFRKDGRPVPARGQSAM